MIVVAITGASGVTYGIRLLEALKELKIETSLIISDAAKTVIEYECERQIEEIINISDNYYGFHDLTSSINSGSFKFDSLVIVPCSMKTLASIAHGFGSNTITRAADVALKERRKCVIIIWVINMNKYMQLAISEAKQGIDNHHGGPFGSVVVKDGRIISMGHNHVLINNDSTCHGDINFLDSVWIN